MAAYSYIAVSSSGNKIEGKREAATRDEIVEYLTRQNMTIITIKEDLAVGLKNLLNIEIGGMPLSERVLISKQLSTMISAGIPIIQAIEILKQQAEKESVRKKFEEIYRIIESGSPLSKAFQKVGGFFSDVQINLIAAGEKSGNLNEMLIKVAEDMEKGKNLKGKIVGAMIYPIIIFFVLIAVVAVMILFMIPQVKELYLSLGETELPGVTNFLVVLGETIGKPSTLFILIGSIAAIVFLYKSFTQKKENKIVVARIKLKIPIFGNLSMKIQLTEFCRLLSMLIKSGIPIVEALEIVSRALSNKLFSEIVSNSRNDITKGASLSLALAKNNDKAAFPLILIKMIATGEESGKMDVVMDDMAKYYEAEVEQITGNLTKLLEPIILLIVGGLVAFMAVAIYLPIYNVANIF
ncbi:MAG: type II secretion system F family protein [Candidatus Dojkabacteria bacterium]|nr:type II secretion system F family protein [Candidatus Dojkabacteria bacterium]MDQ7020462.1 type II secretion system F family protein [Candidatus Dojkabacteria bacterium]